MHVQTELFNHEKIKRNSSNTSYTKMFEIQNRKYIGSKYRLLPFIIKTICGKVKKIHTFIDGFSGTGVVAHAFMDRADTITANDLLYSNYVVNMAFLNSSPENMNVHNVKLLLHELNHSKPEEGYVYTHFGGTYFSYENAGLIDTIRQKINDFFHQHTCTLQEKYILLTSLLYAIDKVANTVGQYDAFLKHLGRESYNEEGTHVIDSNVYKRIVLKIPRIKYTHHCFVYNEDCNDLLKRMKGDVLYLDPPYNNRQYIDNYHVLENIMKWEKPALYGKTKKFERDNLKSRYSRKNEAGQALGELVENAAVNHIFLSYNNEGIIPEETIIAILKERGNVELFKKDYTIFGNGAGVSEKRRIKEKLYYCKVEKH
jgi:adenine-specific DNA-methyltransferase